MWPTPSFVSGASATPSGGFVVVVNAFPEGPARTTMQRYSNDGILDPSFGATGPRPGTVELDNGQGQWTVDVMSDGRVAAVGNTQGHPVAKLFTADGRPDGSFGADTRTPGRFMLQAGEYPGWTVTAGTFADVTEVGGRMAIVGSEWYVESAFGIITHTAALVVRTTVPGSPRPVDGNLLRSMTPTRVLDTRPGAEQVGYSGPKPIAGQTIELQLAGRAGLPSSGIAAVALNLTATEATAPGYVTVWPSGNARPTVSSLNLEQVGQTLPNLVIVPVGADGKVDIFTQSGTHVLADVLGWFPVEGGVQTLVPTRILETRSSIGQIGYTGGKPTAGQTTSLAISVGGAPVAPDMAVAIINLTVTEADAPGFLTVWPSGAPKPFVSQLNVSRSGQTIQNLVLAPVGADGRINIFTMSGGHLIADLVGWLPVGSGYQPTDPSRARVVDTRDTNSIVDAGHSLTVHRASASIEIMNVVATDSLGPGFLTVWPAGANRPNASNLNVEQQGQTIANCTLTATGVDGGISIFTQAGAHLVVDAFGSFPATLN